MSGIFDWDNKRSFRIKPVDISSGYINDKSELVIPDSIWLESDDE